jgi:hypothetical protein
VDAYGDIELDDDAVAARSRVVPEMAATSSSGHYQTSLQRLLRRTFGYQYVPCPQQQLSNTTDVGVNVLGYWMGTYQSLTSYRKCTTHANANPPTRSSAISGPRRSLHGKRPTCSSSIYESASEHFSRTAS